MKKIATYLIISMLIWSCVEKNPKPQNLIPEDKMLDILYDLNLLQAIRSNNYQLFETQNLEPKTFVYEKYDIDSLQFVESHKYYVSDIEYYEKMLDKIINRIKTEKETSKNDSLSESIAIDSLKNNLSF